LVSMRMFLILHNSSSFGIQRVVGAASSQVVVAVVAANVG